MRRSRLAAAVVSGVVGFSTVALVLPAGGQAPPPPAPVTPAAPGGAPAAPAVPPAPGIGGGAADPAKPAPSVGAVPAGAVPAGAALPAPARKKLTFLGLDTSALPQATREQIKLPAGVGILLDAVDPGGPAEQAGLKPGDVFEKLDDQLLFHPEQFVRLVRAAKPGTECTVSIYRDGKPQQIKATYGEKDHPRQQQAPPAAELAALPRAPTLNLTAAPVVGFQFDNAVQLDNLPFWEQVVAAPVAEPIFVNQNVGRQQGEWSDGQHTINIERENGKTVAMTIRDSKSGKKLLEARPFDDKALQEIVKAIPDLQQKVKQAEEALVNGPRGAVNVFEAAPQPAEVVQPNPQPTRRIAVRAAPARPGAVAGGGAGGMAAPQLTFTNRATGRGRVATWQDDDQLFIMRFVGTRPAYLLALSKKDGRTLYDGPVMTKEQQSGLPAEVAEPFALLAAKPELAKEFGDAPKTEQPKTEQPKTDQPKEGQPQNPPQPRQPQPAAPAELAK